MRPRTMVALNLAGTAVLVSVLFWIGKDHSPLMLIRWSMFFIATLVVPMYLSGKVDAALARLPQPVPQELNRAAVYPVWVGILTLGAALALIEPLR